MQTLPALNVSDSSARLQGNADPKGSPAEFWFEWSSNLSGLSAGSGNQTPPQTYVSATNFQGTIANLRSDTTYHFRTAARRVGGTTLYGEALNFTTLAASVSLPEVRTLPADVTDDSVVLHGHADPKGSPAEFWFETATNPSTLLAGNGDRSPPETFTVAQNFQGTLIGLPPETTTHFRAAAQRDGGSVVHGEALSFTTTTQLATIEVKFEALAGAQSGTVTVRSAPAGLDCTGTWSAPTEPSGTCEFGFRVGQSITLTKQGTGADADFLWAGACAGVARQDACVLVLNPNARLVVLVQIDDD